MKEQDNVLYETPDDLMENNMAHKKRIERSIKSFVQSLGKKRIMTNRSVREKDDIEVEKMAESYCPTVMYYEPHSGERLNGYLLGISVERSVEIIIAEYYNKRHVKNISCSEFDNEELTFVYDTLYNMYKK